MGNGLECIENGLKLIENSLKIGRKEKTGRKFGGIKGEKWNIGEIYIEKAEKWAKMRLKRRKRLEKAEIWVK